MNRVDYSLLKEDKLLIGDNNAYKKRGCAYVILQIEFVNYRIFALMVNVQRS